jgi:molybdate transport system regulatory protein
MLSDHQKIKDWQGPVFGVRLRLWIETEEGLFFGTGRTELLDGIERYGSLRKAADELNMSYRAAWGKIKRTEEILGFRLVEKTASRKEGYRLTEAGRELKEKFDRWIKEVKKQAVKKGRAIFGPETIALQECNRPKRNKSTSTSTTKKRQKENLQNL